MPKKTRKRGIRASRERLEMALLKAGIRTQAALAERMAEAEGLSSPPKDTVNRVFREEPVSPATLARIARILGIEVKHLCRETSAGTHSRPERTPTRQDSLLLVARDQDSLAFAEALRKDLTASRQTVILDPALRRDDEWGIDLARRHPVDAVVSVRSRNFGRYRSLQVFLYHRGRESLLWSDEENRATQAQRAQLLAGDCTATLLQALEGKSQALGSEQLEAREKCLLARQRLEQYQNESEVTQAQQLARSALRLEPELTLARSVLAEALLDDSWRSDTRSLLDEAERLLDEALKREPDHPHALSIRVRLLCARGRSSDAIDQARPLAESDETGPDLLIALAQAYLEDSQSENSRQQNPVDQARGLASRATEIEPDYWRHHLELGNILFLTGNPLDAQPAYEASIACRPTEVALINLGMIRVCMGRLEKAREHFEQARSLRPDSYLGHEYLGTIHFLQRRYGEAIRHYRKAIACFTESDALSIHQIWSNLGDACRLEGEKEAAVEAYLKTIEVIHHDRLQGLDNPGYRLAHYHAWFCLSQLDPARYEVDRLEAICNDLSSLLGQPLNPGGLARLSWLLYRQGDQENSHKALEAAVAICPGLSQHPDLSAVLQVSRPEPSTAAEERLSLPSAST